MLKKILILLLFPCVCCSAAENFKSFTRKFNTIKRTYREAMEQHASSARGQKLQEELAAFRKSCAEFQQLFSKMKYMEDLQWQRYSELLQKELSGSTFRSTRKSGIIKGSILSANDVPVELLIDLLDTDIEELEDLKFNPLNPEKLFVPTMKEWADFYQFLRLFQYYRSIRNRLDEYTQNFAYRKMFEQRLALMQELAPALQKHVEKEYPDFLEEVDIAVETKILKANYSVKQQFASDIRQLNSEILKNDSRKENVDMAFRNLDKVLRNITTELQEIDNALLREEKQKSREEEKKKKEEEKEKQKQNAAAGKERPPQEKQKPRLREAVKKPAPPPRYERMDSAELSRLLTEKRNAVFPAREQTELGDSQYEKCLTVLTSSQKKQLESFRLRQERSGKSSADAKLAALRDLHFVLSSPTSHPDRKEMIELLKAEK